MVRTEATHLKNSARFGLTKMRCKTQIILESEHKRKREKKRINNIKYSLQSTATTTMHETVERRTETEKKSSHSPSKQNGISKFLK